MGKAIKKVDALQILGNNIKTIRLSRGMTQEQMAEKLDRSINFVSLIELGKSGMSVPTIIDICNILDVDVSCIFKGLLDYKLKEKDKNIIDNINFLSNEDKEIVENLVKHLIKKNSK